MCKCPVCGKSGIPDYLHETVICPNCNSDLGVYKTLHAIADSNNNSGDKARKSKVLSIVLFILAVLLIGALACVYSNREINVSKQQLVNANTIISELRDSISLLSTQLQSHQTTTLQSGSQYIEYTVIPNDSPWRIVRKFYGNRKDWDDISQKIAEANDLWDNNTATWKQIHPGQIVKIYNIK